MPKSILVIGKACADQSKNGLLAVCEQSEAVADEEYAVDRSNRAETSHNYSIRTMQKRMQCTIYKKLQ